AGGHGEVADQPRPDRARAADPQTARRRLQPDGIASRRSRSFTHGSLLMNVKTEQSGAISIVRVGETRLMYPILADFSTAVTGLIASGDGGRRSGEHTSELQSRGHLVCRSLLEKRNHYTRICTSHGPHP